MEAVRKRIGIPLRYLAPQPQRGLVDRLVPALRAWRTATTTRCTATRPTPRRRRGVRRSPRRSTRSPPGSPARSSTPTRRRRCCRRAIRWPGSGSTCAASGGCSRSRSAPATCCGTRRRSYSAELRTERASAAVPVRWSRTGSPGRTSPARPTRPLPRLLARRPANHGRPRKNRNIERTTYSDDDLARYRGVYEAESRPWAPRLAGSPTCRWARSSARSPRAPRASPT